MLKSIRGVVTISVSGNDVYKFINGIREERIVCTSQKCSNGVFFGEIYHRDVTKVEEIAELLGLKLTIVKRSGIRFRLLAYRYRFGIIIGIIAALGLVFYFSNTVITIEVSGNKEITEKQVTLALSEMGLKKGTFIPDVDFHRCEQQLMLSIPQLAWVGIRHTGSRVCVDIAEAVPRPQMVNDDIPCNIISTKDAQITEIEVYAGEAARRVGDGVKKGDMIVSGTVDDGGGHFLKKHAMGNIRGKYYQDVVFTQEYESTEQVYTDDKESRKYFDFFGLRIPMFIGESEYETYDYSERENKFSLLGIELPLGLIHCDYEPFEYQKVVYSREEAEKRLEEKTSLYEKNYFSGSDIIILERSIKKDFSDTKAEFHVTYTLEGSIGEDSEIFVD